ncbi:MAG: peptidoglycan-binding protein, partial [Rothia dentocariosa]
NVTGYSITGVHIKLLQEHYGLTADGTLDSPSPTIEALQNEINQYVG